MTGEPMMQHDPAFRMLERQSVNKASNQVRNKLQLQARVLEQKYYELISNGSVAHVNCVSKLIGEIEGYISIRRQLAPVVAQDGFSASLTQKAKHLESIMEKENALI